MLNRTQWKKFFQLSGSRRPAGPRWWLAGINDGSVGRNLLPEHVTPAEFTPSLRVFAKVIAWRAATRAKARVRALASYRRPIGEFAKVDPGAAVMIGSYPHGRNKDPGHDTEVSRPPGNNSRAWRTTCRRIIRNRRAEVARAPAQGLAAGHRRPNGAASCLRGTEHTDRPSPRTMGHCAGTRSFKLRQPALTRREAR